MAAPDRPAAGTKISTGRRRISGATWQLVALGGLAVLSAGAVLVGPRPAAMVGGLLLGLVLPGAALTRALFPSRGLSTTELLVLVPAMSLATLVLGGLGLDGAGIRLTRQSWCVLTATVTIVAAIAGRLRHRRRRAAAAPSEVEPSEVEPSEVEPSEVEPPGQAETDKTDQHAEATPGRAWVSRRRVALHFAPLVLAAGVLAGAGWLSLYGTEHQPTEPFTTLEMVPAFASEAPGPTRTVSVGLHCHERIDSDYVLAIHGDPAVEGGAPLSTELRVRLRPGESWARHVQVPSIGRVTVDLYKDGGSTPYRTVFLESTR
jgi:hypothetical protein